MDKKAADLLQDYGPSRAKYPTLSNPEGFMAIQRTKTNHPGVRYWSCPR